MLSRQFEQICARHHRNYKTEFVRTCLYLHNNCLVLYIYTQGTCVCVGSQSAAKRRPFFILNTTKLFHVKLGPSPCSRPPYQRENIRRRAYRIMIPNSLSFVQKLLLFLLSIPNSFQVEYTIGLW